MLTQPRNDLLVLLAMGVAAAGCVSCTSIPVARCESLPCASLDLCVQGGRAMLAQEQPDAAACYFKQAAQFDPRSPAARLGLAMALSVTGRSSAARNEFRWVSMNAPNPEDRATAAQWIQAIDNPVSVAFFYSPTSGCGETEDSTAKYAASVLRSNLPRFGAFVPAGKGVARAPYGGVEALCNAAGELKARIAIEVQVSCTSSATQPNPSYLGGMVRIYGVTKHSSTVRLRVLAYSVSGNVLGDTVVEEGSASSVFSGLGRLKAIDRAIARCILGLASRLLIG